MLQMATVFSNAAFMGIPLIQVMLGAECAIYASIYNVTYNFFLWTLGVHLCTVREGEDLDGDGDHDKDDRRLSAHRAMKKESSILRVLVHPVTVASVLGILCLVLGVNVSAMEDAGLGIVTQSLDMLAALVAPLSMVVIGLRIPDVSLRGAFSDLNMYLYLALRHLILPLAVVGIMRLSLLLGIGIGEEALLVVTVLAAVPSASSATMFAEKYGCDAAYVSRLVIISTLLSIATLPLVTTLATLGL
jgi:predicted permease